MRRQMQEDEQKARLLEESISRWERRAMQAPAESGGAWGGPPLGWDRVWPLAPRAGGGREEPHSHALMGL